MSGAYVAIEEEYDILGVFVLGIVTSFVPLLWLEAAAKNGTERLVGIFRIFR